MEPTANRGDDDPSSKHKHPVVSFSHIHIYTDHLEDLAHYKQLEANLNELAKKQREASSSGQAAAASLEETKKLWQSIVTVQEEEESTDDDEKKEATSDDVPFLSQKRDVVRQMLAGFGFRITGARYPSSSSSSVFADPTTVAATTTTTTNTRSVLVTSRDPNGIQVLVTAAAVDSNTPEATTATASTTADPFHHFDASCVETFYKAHHERQGIAVLAFSVTGLDTIHQRYLQHHPKLVSHFGEYEEQQVTETGDNEKVVVVVVKILEVFAFYKEHGEGQERQADQGTILRFMELPPTRAHKILPGLVPLEAVFAESSLPAYCDHWVSNVISRTEFLQTLDETLGFHPKVDFNAGVVAAGEAQIESTVTGNDSELSTNDKAEALRDQSQVYLPINNALSEVGHVHMFLKEIGQGVQHVASRVENLVEFVQRVNDQRQITSEGFTFLKIPRSYYGVLTLNDLIEIVSQEECAQQIWTVLEKHNLVGHDGAVDLAIDRNQLDSFLSDDVVLDEYQSHKEKVLDVILRSRYKNLYSLLRDHLSEDKYLGIVRNQILVDIQGEDLLYQIFTCKILHREARDEAPFFEFIERVCSECQDDENGCPQKIRPGCGGFGIRNFLTLFLSIEVSKAMNEVANARETGDLAKQEYEQRRVDYFTAQLNESNPILTEISDAMTEEGKLQQRLSLSPSEEGLKMQLKQAEERKKAGNAKLMKTSSKYNEFMKSLRESLQ